jgi:LPS sulfotransferase NodH
MEAVPATENCTPVKSYLICAIPRTGSYLLCDMLKATGVAGNPNEYFSDSYQRHWAARWGSADYDAYLRRVVGIATTPNGVTAVKTHPWQFNHFARQATGRAPVRYVERPPVLERWFPDLHYVWLRRKDRLLQAISYTRSLQTNIWWDADNEPVPNAKPKPEALAFDFDLITQSVARMVEEEDMWRRYFAAVGVDPLVVYYEDLVVDPDRSVRSVLELLEVEPVAGYRAEPRGFRRQADDITNSWAAQYRSEIARGPYNVWRATGPRIGALELLRAAAPADPEPAKPASSEPAKSSAAASAATPPATSAATPPATTQVDLYSALESRRWLRCSSPFPYVRAHNVFSAPVYGAMTTQYEDLM